MELLHITRSSTLTLSCPCQYVNRAALCVDDRCGCDANAGKIKGQFTSVLGTVPIPLAESRKFTCQSGSVITALPSNAYTLSCSVATNTTLCLPFPAISMLGIKSGCAYPSPSTGNEYSFPNCLVFTFSGV